MDEEAAARDRAQARELERLRKEAERAEIERLRRLEIRRRQQSLQQLKQESECGPRGSLEWDAGFWVQRRGVCLL